MYPDTCNLNLYPILNVQLGNATTTLLFSSFSSVLLFKSVTVRYALFTVTVPVRYTLFIGTVLVRFALFTGTAPVRYALFTGTVPVNNLFHIDKSNAISICIP